MTVASGRLMLQNATVIPVEYTADLREALATFVTTVNGSRDPQLRAAVAAYVDQVDRFLTLADEAASAGRILDAETLVISAQRWLWKIAKTCVIHVAR